MDPLARHHEVMEAAARDLPQRFIDDVLIRLMYRRGAAGGDAARDVLEEHALIRRGNVVHDIDHNHASKRPAGKGSPGAVM